MMTRLSTDDIDGKLLLPSRKPYLGGLRLLSIVALASYLCLSMQLNAEDYAVVVSSQNNAHISGDDVMKIFLGKKKRLTDGGEIVPIMQKTSATISKKFSSVILKKTIAQFRSYWSRMMFSGKGYPPKQYESDVAVKKKISENKKYIGIITMSAVDDSVKVVVKF